ncbi:acid protease [Mycena albidolilacea]|uniref:Acid protease n=1 Tax=Mycena albidolilacea TaxID=1033008 RepID=A0AAD7A996_9AGAR|nr:acid protease [Mycena albidolilacea]
MQLPAHFLALLAAVTLISVDARPVKRAARMITLPIRQVQRDMHVHVELRHQHQINRAERLMARAAGLPDPSPAQVRAKLERRASFIPALAERFNIPSADYLLPADESGDVINSLVQDDDSDTPPVLAKNSSQVFPIGADTDYVAVVEIGTPSRPFNILLDSGSGDFWVGSTNCKGEDGGGCGNHTFLSEVNSQSFVNTKKKFSDSYGSGQADGDIVTDTVILAGMVLSNHTFGAASSLSASFVGDKVSDGLMGLGGKGLSNQGVPTPVQALKNAGFIDSAITSYRLPRFLDQSNVGEVTFGGVDETKFDASTLVQMKNADGGNGFWLAPLGGVSINGGDVRINSTVAILDTGTTLLIAPTPDAAAIHAQIPGAKLQDSGSYTIPCNTAASVALKFGGKSFVINPKDLLFASGGRTSGDCTSGIGAFDDDKFLVGNTFLKSVYFSTNADDNTMTLAKAI